MSAPEPCSAQCGNRVVVHAGCDTQEGGREFLTACCGDVLPPVAAAFSDRPCGSLVPPLRAGTDDGDPFSGWPLVELAPTPVAPSGQPVPSPAQQCPAEALPVPSLRLSHPGHRSSVGTPAPVPGGQPAPQLTTRPRPGRRSSARSRLFRSRRPSRFYGTR